MNAYFLVGLLVFYVRFVHMKGFFDKEGENRIWGGRYTVPDNRNPHASDHFYSVFFEIGSYLLFPDDSIVFCGTYEGYLPVVIKLSSKGEVLWSRKFGWNKELLVENKMNDNDEGEEYSQFGMLVHIKPSYLHYVSHFSPKLVNEGEGTDFLFGGMMTYVENPEDNDNPGLVKEYVYVIKINGDTGRVKWSKLFWNENFQQHTTEGNGMDEIYSHWDERLNHFISKTKDGNYLSVSQHSFPGSSFAANTLVIKLSTDGDVIWTNMIKGANTFVYDEHKDSYHFLCEGIEKTRHTAVVKLSSHDGSIQKVLWFDDSKEYRTSLSVSRSIFLFRILEDESILLASKYGYIHLFSKSGKHLFTQEITPLKDDQNNLRHVIAGLGSIEDFERTSRLLLIITLQEQSGSLFDIYQSLRNPPKREPKSNRMFPVMLELEVSKTGLKVVKETVFDEGNVLRKNVFGREMEVKWGIKRPNSEEVLFHYLDEYHTTSNENHDSSNHAGWWNVFQNTDFSSTENLCEAVARKTTDLFDIKKKDLSVRVVKEVGVEKGMFEVIGPVELVEIKEGLEKEFLDAFYNKNEELGFQKKEEICVGEEEEGVKVGFWVVLVLMIIGVVVLSLCVIFVVVVVWKKRKEEKDEPIGESSVSSEV